MDEFRNVGIIGRLNSAKVIETIKRLRRFLAAEGMNIILEEKIASVMMGHGLQVCSPKMMGEICDLVVVIGGDGSLLGAARALAKSNVPILGVNRGRLGFLTDISPSNLEEKVAEVLDGQYVTERRFMLEAEVKRNGEPIGYGEALNDVILHPGKSARMIAFDMSIEGQFVYHQRSDGMIVSTPTGSTAYSLSGGGPIMHPKLDAVALVPMFPHTLSSRPIVVDANSEIKITISPEIDIYPQVSCDGQVHITAAPGDTVTIRKHAHKVRLIHPMDHDFYATCRNKLGWAAQNGEG